MANSKKKIPLNSLGIVIKEARENQKLRPIDLAWKINNPKVTEKTIKKWEKGTEFPDLDMMYKLAEILKLNPNELLSLRNKIQEDSYSKPNKFIRKFGGLALEGARPIVKIIITWIGIVLILYLTLKLKDFMNMMLDPSHLEQIEIIEGAIQDGINTYVE